MKPENKKFLEDNRHHWITLRDAKFCRHLDGNTRSGMMRVMSEEFRPGYTADLWCGTCVAEMVKQLYHEFEKWEAAQPPVVEMYVLNGTDGLPEKAAYVKREHGEIIQISEEEAIALAEKAKALEDAANKTTQPPIQVKANFPSHKKHPRR